MSFDLVESKLFTFKLELTKAQQKEVQTYLDSLSVRMIFLDYDLRTDAKEQFLADILCPVVKA